MLWTEASPVGSTGERTHPALRDVPAEMKARLSVHSVVIAAPEQVSCPLGDESAILSLKNSVYYGLDSVGARVWNLLLQKPRSIGDLRDTLLGEYDVEAESCERDLFSLLEKMQDEGLIEVRSAAATS